jgi:diguanylate cyclase
MDSTQIDIKEFHWLMDMLQSIDVGLIVLDRNYQVQVWNSFMANHSGKSGASVIGHNIFGVFAEIPEEWFKRKAESVFLLKNRSFTTWEQRPYLFRFKNYRPITGSAEYMYQNITFIPLVSSDGEAKHIGVIIYDVTDIAVSKTELEQANNLLETLSRTDRLTVLYNRGYWEECLAKEFLRSKRTGYSSSLIMFDIDHFKAVNDSYGHQAGDEVIRRTAETIRKCIRTTDIPGRYGGEEFGIVLIDTDAAGAHYLAERLRTAIEGQTVTTEEHSINFTISLGISELTPDIDDYKQWIEYSDQALYEAKHGGRNQSVIYQKKKEDK